jgi:hypothetical protein
VSDRGAAWEVFVRPARRRPTRKATHYKLEGQTPEIIAAYKRGATASDLARVNGVTPQTILNLLRRNGVEIRRRWSQSPLRSSSTS